LKCLALAAVVLGLCSGCGGFAAAPTFSPLMLFLPGLANSKPGSPQIVPLMQVAPSAQLAANGDSVKVN
jgi:uncharacterized membrane protein YfcA